MKSTSRCRVAPKHPPRWGRLLSPPARSGPGPAVSPLALRGRDAGSSDDTSPNAVLSPSVPAARRSSDPWRGEGHG